MNTDLKLPKACVALLTATSKFRKIATQVLQETLPGDMVNEDLMGLGEIFDEFDDRIGRIFADYDTLGMWDKNLKRPKSIELKRLEQRLA